MAIPKREEILARATAMFFEDCSKHGAYSFVNPEEEELKENGYISAAQSELMRDRAHADSAEWKSYERATAEPEEPESGQLPFDVSQALDTGFFVSGTSQTGKTTLAKTLAKRLIDAGVVVYAIDPSRAWLHDTPINQVIEIVEMRGQAGPWYGSTVFDVSTLNVRDQIAFADTLCKSLIEHHLSGETRYNEFLIFEESQNYLPQGGLRLATRRSNPLENVFKLVTIGANFGLRFGIVTQFSALIDKSVVKIVQQKYCGSTFEPNDIKYLKGFLGKAWSEKLSALQRGQFVYQNRERTSLIQTGPYSQSVQTDKRETQYTWNYRARVVQQCDPLQVVA